MKLYALLIYDENHKLTYSKYNLDDFYFFIKAKMQETIEIFSKELIKNVKLNSYYKITDHIQGLNLDIEVYGLTSNKYYIAITDPSYHRRVAFSLLGILKNEKKSSSEIDNLFMSYQNPNSFDKILQTKQEIDETKLILLDSIDKLLERGESLDDLVDKAKNLSATSALFKKKTNELNSCCSLF